MRRSLAVATPAAATLLVLAGCAGYQTPGEGPRDSAPISVPDALGTYRASGTVLESPDHGPQLCQFVATSYPPQCGGIDLVGWDWDSVDGVESANGTTWGGPYEVTGTWDGDQLTLTEPPTVPGSEPPDLPDFATPCPEPPGGWQPVDPSKADDNALNAAVIAANDRPDFAGLWLDGSIINVRVTGDIAAAERDLREIWGGALCVSPAERTEEELMAIQNEISDDAATIRMMSSSLDTETGTIEVQVVLDDGTLQATYDERYGPGLVRVTSWLQPA